MGMYASTVIVAGAGRGLRRALTIEPSDRGAVVQAGARNTAQAEFGYELTGMREWVARSGGGAP
jgi:hypothetical protein